MTNPGDPDVTAVFREFSNHCPPDTGTQMVSPAFNVLRWSALVGGVAYGFLHNRTLANTAAAHRAQAAFDKKAQLIEEARAEYRKLHPKKEAATSAVADINDPKFDPVEYIEQQIAAL